MAIETKEVVSLIKKFQSTVWDMEDSDDRRLNDSMDISGGAVEGWWIRREMQKDMARKFTTDEAKIYKAIENLVASVESRHLY